MYMDAYNVIWSIDTLIYNDIHWYIIIVMYCISIYNVLVFYTSMYVCVSMWSTPEIAGFATAPQWMAVDFPFSTAELQLPQAVKGPVICGEPKWAWRWEAKSSKAGGTSPQAESQQKKIGFAYRIQECVECWCVLLDSDSIWFPWCPFPNHEIKWFRAG